MGAMLLRIKCRKCGKLLLEFKRGEKGAEIEVNRYGTTVTRPGIAKCDKCGSETAFDTKYLPLPKG